MGRRYVGVGYEYECIHEAYHPIQARLPFSYTHTPAQQSLYGIIQGGVYEDLRQRSTAFVNDHPFFGAAIGGSLGADKRMMYVYTCVFMCVFVCAMEANTHAMPITLCIYLKRPHTPLNPHP